MLGRHADAFFARQARETVLAGAPNGDAGSIAFPDREAPGTGKIARVSGQYEMPGPQNTHAGRDMLPGMGQDADMLPGMGQADMLPGMGALSTGKMLLVGGAVAAGLLWFASSKTSPAPVRRRRRSRRRLPKRDRYGRFTS